MGRELLELTEYAKCIVELDATERDRLLQPELKFGVIPVRGSSQYAITPSLVGVVDLPLRTVRVQPRFGIRNALFLISYSIDPDGWQAFDLPFDEDDSLTDALAYIFVLQLRRTFRHGVLQGYRGRDESLPVVRGRIRLSDQVRTRYGRMPPVEVSYDEFSEDIIENRLIKAALLRLSRLHLRNRDVRVALSEFETLLETVAAEEFLPWRVPLVAYTRLNGHYRPSVELARLILQGFSLEFRSGSRTGAAFLIDMAPVFEKFLAVALRDRLRAPPQAMFHGMARRSLWLDVEQSVALKPDFSSWRDERCDWVADAKYKTSVEGPRESDVYQLLAYTIAADVPWGVLIYADGKASRHTTRYSGKRLDVTAIDLTQNPSEILRQVEVLAKQMDEMHELRRTPVRAS